MIINVINKSGYPLPEYKTSKSAGVDLKAALDHELTLEPRARLLVPTGLYLELPDGYEAQIRPRSGLALKHGISVLNSPGTIDADYRGEIGVILINHSKEPFQIKPGERIAQMIIARYEAVKFQAVELLEQTERGDGGFGSTGVD